MQTGILISIVQKENFNKKINGLHFNGNCKEELWNIVKKTMDQASFDILCK